jgi:hypothetical protein
MGKEILPRITVAPKGSFFLFGARGVGKSTWARQTFADAYRFDLLDEGLFQSLLADPGLFGAGRRPRRGRPRSISSSSGAASISPSKSKPGRA